MAAEHQYFYEDEVYRINKKGNIEFGMVLENSELVSSDENSDAEDGGRMKKGHIRVAWHPTGVEEVIPERKVQLADRSLMPGDVVRRMIKGKDTQRGYCRDIKVVASVQVVGTKQVIPNVRSENLVPLEEFATDIAACLDSWVGGIKTVHSKLLIQCSDGSRCVINDIEASGLEDFNEKKYCDCEFPSHRDDFYPGQTLWGPLHCLEDAEWIHCTKELKAQRNKANRIIKVVVEEVRTDSVGVHWQCRAYSKDGAGAEKEQPKFLVQGDDLKRLKLLNVFEPCTLQVGDRNFYVFRAEDTVITKEQWRRYQHDLIASGNSVTNGPAVALLPAKIGSPKIGSPKMPKNKGHQNPSRKYQRSSNKIRKLGDTDTSGKACSESVNKEPSSQTANQGDDNIVPSAVPMVEITNGSPVVCPEQNATVDLLEEWDTEDTASVSDSMSISSGCSSVGSQGKKKRGPALMTKVLKKKKLRRTRKRVPTVPLIPGQKMVVETLSTSSVADVVWQDGSVEYGIPSTQLYPIHHLDDQEFFPGDFVIENKEESCMRVYGVVQSVDHAGRTATVKWFKTYTSLEEPRPAFLEENEVSVYDLKDHPDFQYRPGTVVIRVANFEGEDANCTAGQVLDNYPEGMVRVWWVDGHISMSWPQDLYKVGEYDSEEGELWDDGSSDGSWETESEDCFIADDVFPEEDLQEMLKPKLAANIEKARIAMSRLEEIFTQNPSLQTTSVMRQLLDVYKDCRYLDKLMGTSFFHESHFQGLLERVRERGRANVAQRVADQVSRLFHQSDNEDTDKMQETCSNTLAEKRSDTEFCIKCPEMGVARKEEGLLPDIEMLKDGKQLSSDIKADCIVEKESGVPIVIVKDAVAVPHAASNKDSSTNSVYLRNENLVNLERDVVSITNKNPYYKSVPEVEENSREIVKESHSSITKAAIGNGLRSIGSCNTSKLHNQSESGNNAKYNGCYNSPVVTNTGVGKARHTTHAPVGTTSQGDDKGGTGHNHNGCLNSIGSSVSSRSKSSLSTPGGTSCSSQGPKQTPDGEAQNQVTVVSNSHVCVRLCSLIKAQLVKAHGEVTRRFGGNQGLMTLSDAFNTHSPIDNGSHKDENEVEDDNAVTDMEIPLTKKEGSESLMAQDKAADLSEKTSAALTEVPHITEKVKDGLRDMFHAISRFGQGAGNAIAPAASNIPQAGSPKSAGSEEPKSNAEEEKAKPETVLKPTMIIDTCGEGFSIMDSAPNSHKFKLTMFQPTDPQLFFRTVRKEIKLLRTSLPPGIWVKGFEDRMDLYSVMIRGPEKTPYEDGLFFFDFQLSADYPKAPPLCHYISYCSDRLNPNLYEDGKVCVSLLGTWSGKGTEVWTLNSNLLQVIISIQGLILVSEPYFNEAGYEKQKGSQQGKENSRMYNEMAVLKLVQSLTKLILQPPPVFCEEIMEHFRQTAYKLLKRLETWLEISERYNSAHPVTPTTPTSFREIHGEAISNALNAQLPEFPLIPASKGFCLTLRKTLVTFRGVLCSVGIREQPNS